MKRTINRLPGTSPLLTGLCFYALADYAPNATGTGSVEERSA